MNRLLKIVAAVAYFASVSPSFAVVYAITDLGTLVAGGSIGFGINNSGQVVGGYGPPKSTLQISVVKDRLARVKS
jgi:hypothetical protein